MASMDGRVADTFGRTPEEGAHTVLWLATAPETASSPGSCSRRGKEIPTPGQGSGPAARPQLWTESQALTDLT